MTVAQLAAAQHAAGRPLRFDEYLAIVLYGEHGFYTTSGQAGRRGDFITSPEVGPLFAAVLARWIDAEHARLGAPEALRIVLGERRGDAEEARIGEEARAVGGDPLPPCHVGGEAGLHYAGVTLLTLRETCGGKLPCGTITDGPRFGWRGQHLDCARHFFGVDFILRLLDLMALLKLNRFHWHLSDDEAFRLEVESQPRLWQRTAFRGEGELVPGVFGGIQEAYGPTVRVGLLWLDAHGDFNTPRTTLSGMLGGMPVAVSAGLAWPNWRERSGTTTRVRSSSSSAS